MAILCLKCRKHIPSDQAAMAEKNWGGMHYGCFEEKKRVEALFPPVISKPVPEAVPVPEAISAWDEKRNEDRRAKAHQAMVESVEKERAPEPKPIPLIPEVNYAPMIEALPVAEAPRVSAVMIQLVRVLQARVADLTEAKHEGEVDAEKMVATKVGTVEEEFSETCKKLGDGHPKVLIHSSPEESPEDPPQEPPDPGTQIENRIREIVQEEAKKLGLFQVPDIAGEIRKIADKFQPREIQEAKNDKDIACSWDKLTEQDRSVMMDVLKTNIDKISERDYIPSGAILELFVSRLPLEILKKLIVETSRDLEVPLEKPQTGFYVKLPVRSLQRLMDVAKIYGMTAGDLLWDFCGYAFDTDPDYEETLRSANEEVERKHLKEREAKQEKANKDKGRNR